MNERLAASRHPKAFSNQGMILVWCLYTFSGFPSSLGAAFPLRYSDLGELFAPLQVRSSLDALVSSFYWPFLRPGPQATILSLLIPPAIRSAGYSFDVFVTSRYDVPIVAGRSLSLQFYYPSFRRRDLICI